MTEKLKLAFVTDKMFRLLGNRDESSEVSRLWFKYLGIAAS